MRLPLNAMRGPSVQGVARRPPQKIAFRVYRRPRRALGDKEPEKAWIVRTKAAAGIAAGEEGKMAITDWPAAERPRERLLALGAAQLSDAELLAIFLRTGSRGQSALDMARSML